MKFATTAPALLGLCGLFAVYQSTSGTTSRALSTDAFNGAHGLQTIDQHINMFKTCSAGHLSTTDGMTIAEFMDEVFDSLSHVERKQRPLQWVAENFDHLAKERGALTHGSWTEFGVFTGATLEMAHKQLTASSSFDGVVAGFDSFEGLPTKWRNGFEKGTFASAKGNLYEHVRNLLADEVELYKGWFQDTIGEFVVKHPTTPATLIHHDGDLFISTAITFALMNRYIVPGTILCFDELMGYPGYEGHEMLSLFIWMKEHQATLCPLAVKGPVDIEGWKNPVADRDPHEQSACFQVLVLDSSA